MMIVFNSCFQVENAKPEPIGL